MIAAWGRRVLVALATTTALATMTSLGAASAPRVETDLRPSAAHSLPQVTPSPDRVLVVPGSVTPGVVDRSTAVAISGTVTARSGVPLTGARLRVVTDPTRLNQRSAVASWAESSFPGRGKVVVDQSLPPVAAGQTASFSVTIPPGRIGSDELFAAVPISIEVTPSRGADPSGVTHTFLAWHVRKEYVPIRLSTVIPVTFPPDVDLYSPDEQVRTAAWIEHLGPGSRVDSIVRGTSGHPVTLAVDPSVLGPDLPGDSSTPAPSTTAPPAPSVPSTGSPAPTAPAASPSAGSTSGGATGTPPPTGTTAGPGPGSAAEPPVDTLVNGLVHTLRGRSVWALPYADADLAATVDIDATNPLVRDLVDRSALVATKLGASTGAPVRTDVFWPVDGRMPAGRDRALGTLVSGTDVDKVSAVVVSQDAVTSRSAYTPNARRATPKGTLLLGYDDDLSALLPRKGDSPALATQQFLADTLVLLGERPGTERSILLAAPRDYEPDPQGLAAFLRTVAAADWLRPVDANTLLKDDGTGTPRAQETPNPAPAAIVPRPVLSAARLAAMAEQRDTLLQVATVLRDGAAFEARYREVLDELASARWRGAPIEWTQLSDSVVADTKAATRAIKVKPKGVNFLAARGTIRITVQNGLGYTIDGIRLVLQPSNPRLMTVEQPGPITIGPGAQTTVPVSLTALAAGRVEIRAFLTTADGTPIGEPAVMRVSANPLDSTIYWVGAVLVGLILLAGVIRTIRKGTSRVDEIGDLETLAAEAERIEDGGRG